MVSCSWLIPSPSNYTSPNFKFSDITLITWNYRIYTKAMKKCHKSGLLFPELVHHFSGYIVSHLGCTVCGLQGFWKKRYIQDSFEIISLYVWSLKPHPPWLWYNSSFGKPPAWWLRRSWWKVWVLLSWTSGSRYLCEGVDGLVPRKKKLIML